VFTVQNSFFQANSTKDPNFTGSFGLAWYQSDIKIGKQTDDGHVQIKTILLDDIFGFDPDVRLAPTNTFHLGFWFDNPEDAATLPTCHFDPTKPTPFNGEHKAGPFAMLSAPDAKTTWDRSAPARTTPQPQPAATPTEAAAGKWRGDEGSPLFLQFLRTKMTEPRCGAPSGPSWFDSSDASEC
jgi:hypothetical protein